MPAVVVVMVVSATPKAERAVVQGVVIHRCIVAVGKVYAVVGSAIGMIARGGAIIVVVAVGVAGIDTHTPSVPVHIQRTVEVVALDEAAVLPAAKHIHEVFVAHIEQIVVVVDGVVVAVRHIVDNFVDLVEEVEVYLIHVFILAVAEAQFVAHTVGKETCLAADIGQAHCRKTVCTDSCQGYNRNG